MAEDEAGDEGANDGVSKHRSALSRLKEKFRRSQAPADDKHEGEEEKPSTGTGTGVAAGAAGGAVTGATLEEAAAKPSTEQSEELDEQQAAHAVAGDNDSLVSSITADDRDFSDKKETTHEKDVVPAADEEKEEKEEAKVHTNKWGVVVAGAAGAGAAGTAVALNEKDTDDVPEVEDKTPKPERPAFEQKPSLVGYRNDEDSGLLPAGKVNLERHISHIPESDDDEDDEDWNDEREGKTEGTLGTEKAQVVADRVGTAPVMDKPVDDPIPTNERTDETLAQMDDQRADPPKDLPSTLETPGVPKPAPSPETESSAAAKDAQRQGSKTQEAAAVGAASAGTAAAAESSKTNKLSKSQPDLKTSIDKNERSGKLEKTPKTEKESKGFRGFIKKLRNRDSRSENKAPDALSPTESQKSIPYESTKAGDAPATDTTSPTGAKPELPPVETGPKLGDEHIGTDGPIGDSQKVSGIGGNPEPDSPSSFKRGETALNDPDDVSSSGADEDDIARGRGGRISRKLGFGRDKGKKKMEAGTDSDRQNSNTEDEQFEEARDHFDENLAPPPAFAGQAKSESPVRETKFQEQL